MLKTKLNNRLLKIIKQSRNFFNHFSLDVITGRITLFLSSWWHTLIISLAALIFLYYPLGGYLVDNIDRSTSYEINENHPEQSAVVEMMAFIVNREVNEKIWTPNLPFFYPSYFLDNMPNFQLGMFDALSKFASEFAGKADKRISNNKEESDLAAAAELLRYPGTVWMFSAENKLLPAPSANIQYRRARRRLIEYNGKLSSGRETFYKSPSDLACFLNKMRIHLGKSSAVLENHIREESSSWWDTKADDIFYYQQGKTYAYYLLLKALGNDYEEIIVRADIYARWTSLLNTLENASLLQPVIIRNGELCSLTAPNHLSYLNMYIGKTRNLLAQMAHILEQPLPERKN